MKHLILPGILFFISLSFFKQTNAQNCKVDLESINGTYTGNCKKGKANGLGKAVGTDTYSGEFKNGLPDGEGIYTWSNGNTFAGNFSKGLKEGSGKMIFKLEEGKDSLVEGFWKKDEYIGKYEKPYQVFSKTGSIRTVDVEFKSDNTNRVKVIITNVTGGMSSTRGSLPQARVDNTVILKGNYERVTSLETHLKSTESTFFGVLYPFRVKLMIGREEVDVELREEGSYVISIQVVL